MRGRWDSLGLPAWLLGWGFIRQVKQQVLGWLALLLSLVAGPPPLPNAKNPQLCTPPILAHARPTPAPPPRPLPPQLGVSRVVVGRELSVRDISRVSAGSEAEVEAFVHGALCVSYSGQVRRWVGGRLGWGAWACILMVGSWWAC